MSSTEDRFPDTQRLPGMSGYELAQTLRAMPHLASLRLVAITEYGQTEDFQRPLSALHRNLDC